MSPQQLSLNGQKSIIASSQSEIAPLNDTALALPAASVDEPLTPAQMTLPEAAMLVAPDSPSSMVVELEDSDTETVGIAQDLPTQAVRPVQAIIPATVNLRYDVNYYNVLGIQPNVTIESLGKAFDDRSKLASPSRVEGVLLTPDLGLYYDPQSRGAAGKWTSSNPNIKAKVALKWDLLCEAYRVLSDPTLRQMYELGTEWDGKTLKPRHQSSKRAFSRSPSPSSKGVKRAKQNSGEVENGK